MSKRDLIHKEIKALYKSGAELLQSLQEKTEDDFHHDYQRWYTTALKAVASLAPDRLHEFRSYYEIDPKRKTLGYGTYVIQDYIKGVRPGGYSHSDFDTRDQAVRCFYNQITILASLTERIDSLLTDLESELYAELQDSEIVIARQLIKVSPRAAGALMGVIIEGHLHKIASNHEIKITKKNPTIGDLNDLLKDAKLIDVATWRKISFLGDLRNVCAHKKDVEPTKENVDELINGAEWISKNIY